MYYVLYVRKVFMNPLKVSQVYTLASFRVLVATLKTLFFSGQQQFT